jgi:hypothetical protein
MPGATCALATLGERNPEGFQPIMYGGSYIQNDVVGQYLAWRDAQIASMEVLQAPTPHYTGEPAGYTTRGRQTQPSYDSYAYVSPQRWYPDPETIRHLHTLHSLLPHISPERKLNALSGLEIDIIDGNTGQVLCRAVPKKLLVLFLSREVVNKFIRTFTREDNQAWRGLPIEQKLVLPPQATSAAAIKVLVSWMVRACQFATMCSMKPLHLPNNLFVACSFVRTLELFKLHRDASRLDFVLSQLLASKRPIFAVEIETMWTCLGENDKYVYACIRALSRRMSDPKVVEDLRGLAEKYPDLYARLRDPGVNELRFRREWFAKLQSLSDRSLKADRLGFGNRYAAIPPSLVLNDRSGGCEVSNRSPQSVRLPDPSAPAFQPVINRHGGW